ncbi:transcriptional regulator [Pseudoalteromonas sp. NBT06-2]|uniref:helix-turn-helix domain-containing protein n=1 Tax=Pseudoalteromonas sp. NBT06-2 TaxID=2025950 RepID=UPI000BA731BF|nr:helix-turn-helix transcriptional regulator [Pseudoalteromonas sp. NBT06-2]PAJ73342.1 transcriptional regulator [Pseudoalteromonas sp. NBT06-2]
MEQKLASFSSVLGIVIANKRKELAIDQGDFAALLSLSQASYSRLESGKSTFSVDQMFGCAKAIGVSITDLVSAVENTINQLEEKQDISVKIPPRGNANKAKDPNTGLSTFVAGAALGALIIGLAAKSK